MLLTRICSSVSFASGRRQPPLSRSAGQALPCLAPAIAGPMGYAMNDLNSLSLLIFLAAAFAASMITGLAGFAFGIIAAGAWLHILTPSQTTTFVVGYRFLFPE